MHNDIITDIAKAEIQLSRLKMRLNCSEEVEAVKNKIILTESSRNVLPESYKNHLLNKFIGRRKF